MINVSTFSMLMQLPPMKESTEPIVETVDDEEPRDTQDLGQKTMFDLVMDNLRTDNPTVPGLAPDDKKTAHVFE